MSGGSRRSHCEWTHESVEEREDGYSVTADVVCTNAAGETVMVGTIEGRLDEERE